MKVVHTTNIVTSTANHAAEMAKNGPVLVCVSNYTHLFHIKRTAESNVTIVYADMETCRMNPQRLILVQPQWISSERIKVILLGMCLSPEKDAVIITDDKECAERIQKFINQ